MFRERMAAAALVWIAFLSHSDSACSTELLPQSGYWVEELVTGLDLPRSVVWLPNSDMLVAELGGRISVVRRQEIIGQLDGVPRVLTGLFDGLVDIKLDPDFQDNHLIYLAYTEGNDGGRLGRVYQASLEEYKLKNGKVIFTTVPTMPLGASLMLRMQFLPDKTMLVGVAGDHGTAGLAQRLDNHAGKIVRIRRDGSVPSDNPFSKTPQALPEIWAIGFRNPSGFARDDEGTLWAVDIGPKGGDELNQIKPGGNYGWPLVTWGFDYSGKPISAQQNGGDAFVDPTLVWVPAFSPSDLLYYRGDVYAEWRGDLFSTGLGGQALRRIRIRHGQPLLQEDLLLELNERLRSVAIGPDNMIYLLTDAFSKGRMLRIRPGSPERQSNVARALFERDATFSVRRRGAPGQLEFEKGIQALRDAVYDPVKSAGSFAQFCASCHARGMFRTGGAGPDLNGVNGRRSGTLHDYAYSASFKDESHQITWNYETLSAFLHRPQDYFPGTNMVIPHLPAETVSEIVDFLTDGELTAYRKAVFESSHKKTLEKN